MLNGCPCLLNSCLCLLFELAQRRCLRLLNGAACACSTAACACPLFCFLPLTDQLAQAAGHRILVPAVINLLQEAGAGHVQVVAGGVIPREDYAALKDAGCCAIFGPGTKVPKAAAALLCAVVALPAPVLFTLRPASAAMLTVDPGRRCPRRRRRSWPR